MFHLVIEQKCCNISNLEQIKRDKRQGVFSTLKERFLKAMALLKKDEKHRDYSKILYLTNEGDVEKI